MMRWRWVADPNNAGGFKKESNTKLVTFSDGSQQLIIGDGRKYGCTIDLEQVGTLHAHIAPRTSHLAMASLFFLRACLCCLRLYVSHVHNSAQ